VIALHLVVTDLNGGDRIARIEKNDLFLWMSDQLNSTAKEWKPSVAAASWQPSWLPPSDQPTPFTPPSKQEPPIDDEAQPSDEGVSQVTTQMSETNIPPDAPPSQNDEEDQVQQEKEAVQNDEEEPIHQKSAEHLVEEPKSPVKPEAEPLMEVDEAGVAKENEEGAAAVKGWDDRDHLNIVFIGHVDAGKSTLCGSIMYLLGSVDKRTIEKFEVEAKERNRESWFLAYIMDTNEEERAKGKTVEVGRAYLQTPARRFTVLDAPGHKNYVPAMIAGASQADVGILVISARKGEFEAGFDRQGQTREHAMLAKTLGVQRLVVVINKMDEVTVQWSEERFNSIVKRLTPYLKNCGYRVKRDVTFIPISALSGINIKDPLTPGIAPWAEKLNNGKSLLQYLETMPISGRNADGALRMTLIDRYADRGTVVLAKVESGILYKGQTVVVCPNQQKCKVDNIYINEEEVQGAKPGENILVRLNGLQESEVSKGHVVASRFAPVYGCTEIIGELFVTELLEHRPLLSAGYTAIFHAHTADEECTVTEIVALIDMKTGKIAKRNPAFAKDNQKAIVKIKLERSICLEEYSKMMQLGRFTLRDEGKTVAIGIIKKCR